MSDGEEWKGEEDKPYSFLSFGWGRPMTAEERAAYEQKLAERRAKGRLLAATLTRYREDAPCPKCGSLKSRTRHCAGVSHEDPCLDHAGDVEHLHRDCKRCSYTWYELPLDAG
jgi:hypothetical protein